MVCFILKPMSVYGIAAQELVLALQYHTQTPLTWPSIHHIQNLLRIKNISLRS